MKLWTSEHIFSHPWETVVQAAWRKYPNPMNPSVTGVDVLERKIDSDGTLKTHRLMTTLWGMPGWAKAIIGDNRAFVSEHSSVDPQRKIFSLHSRNLTGSNVVTVHETLTYSPHPEDRTKTILKQEAEIVVANIPFTSYMENLLATNISQNAGKGRQGMEWAISKVKEEAADLTKIAIKGMDATVQDITSGMDQMFTSAKTSL
ncbi:PRELI domain containing protein 3A-like [Tubulanus polymorphus]|uniref:PRELI domain containing protein 3A-like n=1 Tax=Tubulanus polymorphus TaxID=672921 RepID=UPI003DA6BEE5